MDRKSFHYGDGTYTIGGTASQNTVSLQFETAGTPIPQPGATVYVTEIFNTFSPITPIGTLAKMHNASSTLYDVAFF